jgi:hypothetical protein
VNIFDRERTIVDAFRYLSKEIAIKALKMAVKNLSDKKLDIKKLQRYAKQFGQMRLHQPAYEKAWSKAVRKFLRLPASLTSGF